MTSNDPSYPEMLTFLVLFISPEDSFRTLAPFSSVSLGSGWAKCTQVCLSARTSVGAPAGRGLQASGVSHHVGKKLGPAGAPVGIWARPEEEVVCGVSSIVPGLGCFN